MFVPKQGHPSRLIASVAAQYNTAYGSAYCSDSRTLMAQLPDQSVDLVLTSPPYALHFKKEYGNVEKNKYVDWFLPFAMQIIRILKPSGSFVLNIGGSYNKGTPTRSLYHHKLLIALCEQVGFHLCQEFFWYNPAKLPAPAEWVNVRRIRVKDAVEYIWWLSPSEWPKADNRHVLVPYSDDMKRLIKRGYRTKRRPSGHTITEKFRCDNDGAIPENVIRRGNNESNSTYIRTCAELGRRPHPARFPSALPEFFVKMLTDLEDVVLDPFAGSNTTGSVAESLHRRWLSVDNDEQYVIDSALRFGMDIQ